MVPDLCRQACSRFNPLSPSHMSYMTKDTYSIFDVPKLLFFKIAIVTCTLPGYFESICQVA